MSIAYNTSVARNGLVLHLDAGNPKSYPGSGNIWYDLSGNGYNATLFNSPAYTTNNIGSLIFDGVSNYATIPSSTQWAVGANATMENFLYFDNSTFTTNHRIWCVSNDAAGIDVGINVSTGTIFTAGSSGYPATVAALPTRQWTHVAVVYNAGTVKIYFNGVDQPLTGTTTGINKTNTNTLFLAQFSGGGGYYFVGKIPMYRLYNRALSSQEIQQNFEAFRGRYKI